MATCIMYHGIVRSHPVEQVTADEFERQMRFLKKICNFVSTEEFLEPSKSLNPKIRTLLTFDDGYRNNLTVVAPILDSLKIPALFFVSLRHSDKDKFLWFSYLNAVALFYTDETVEFGGQRLRMENQYRMDSLTRIVNMMLEAGGDSARLDALLDSGPKLESFVSERALDENFRGLSPSEIRELASSSLFEVGSHTMNHPFLSRCSDIEIEDQMVTSKKVLEQATGKPVRYFAYPSGDYDRRTLDCARRNYSAAFSTNITIEDDARYEITRFGIYRPGLLPLFAKTALGKGLRRLKPSIG